MECKTTTVDLRVLEATPGHRLYRKDEPLETAYFTGRVYLGTGDSADNYAEITEEKAAAMEAARAEKEAVGTDEPEQGEE